MSAKAITISSNAPRLMMLPLCLFCSIAVKLYALKGIINTVIVNIGTDSAYFFESISVNNSYRYTKRKKNKGNTTADNIRAECRDMVAISSLPLLPPAICISAAPPTAPSSKGRKGIS